MSRLSGTGSCSRDRPVKADIAHHRRDRHERNAERRQRRAGRRRKEDRKGRRREDHAAVDGRQLPGAAAVRGDCVVVQRGHAVGFKESQLAPIFEPAVRVHPALIDPVSEPVGCHRVHRRVDRQPVVAREESENVGEHATAARRGRVGEVVAHGDVPRGDRRPLRGAEVGRRCERDIRADTTVSVRREPVRPDHRDAVDAACRRLVHAGRIAVGDAAARNGVGTCELLGSARDPALCGDPGCQPLRCARERRGARDRLVARRPGDEARIPDEDVCSPKSHRRRTDEQRFAGIDKRMQERAPEDRSVAVGAGAPLGVRARPRGAARIEILGSVGEDVDRGSDQHANAQQCGSESLSLHAPNDD